MALSVCFPSKLFKKKLGVGMDGGSSCFKIVHTTEEGDNLRFHFQTIPKNENQKALELFSQLCMASNLDTESEVVICGTSTNLFMEQIRQKTKLNTCNKFEFDMMTKAFHFLSTHQQWDEFVTNPSDKAKTIGRNNALSVKELLTHIHEGAGERSILPEVIKADIRELPEPSCEITFPVLLYVLGSAPAAIKVEADGRYEFVHWQPMGGRALLGLGYHCTGARNFQDLHALAEAGDNSKVHAFLDSKLVGDNESSYNVGDTSIIAFNFGLLAGNPDGEVKKEDMAAALFSAVTGGVARDAYLSASRLNVKQTFFWGGLACASDLTRDLLSTEYVYHCLRYRIEDSTDHYFIQLGPYLAAFGCLLNNLGIA